MNTVKICKRLGIHRLILNSVKVKAPGSKKSPDIERIHEFSPDVSSSALWERTKRGAGQADLAIIVPIYQTEKYVRECLLSLLNQKTWYRYQIILINDGTRDNSMGVIADLLDNPKVLLLEQENRGLSAARNAGLDAADARYVCFVDSDDYVSENMVEAWMNRAVESDADIIAGNFKYYYEKTGRFKEQYITKEQRQDRYRLMGTACFKAFKAELFQQIRFPVGYWFEDSIVKHLLFSMAQSVECVEEPLCIYRLHHTGITVEARKSPKCIDSTYITVQMLKDREQLGLKNSPEYEAYFFEQLIMNAQREEGIPKEIRYEIFCWMAELTESCFLNFKGDGRGHLKLLHRALLHRDFEAYERICRWR